MNQTTDENLQAPADVSSQRIARVYAEALLNAAEKRGQAAEVWEQLDSLVADLFRADPQLEAFLASSAIDREHKARMIESTFGARATELFVNFLQVLNQHQRLDLLRSVRAIYGYLNDQRAGRVHVQVRTAVPLPADQGERLQQELRQMLQRQPVLEAFVDPELLGGMIVRIGSWVYDASVRTQLDHIRNQIIARSSHEIQSRRDHFSSPNGDRAVSV